MIKLTRLDNREFLLNPDLIEFIEATPDTLITLRTEKKIIVKQQVDEVLEKIVEFKRSVYTNPFFQRGNKTYINSDTPDLFSFKRNTQNIKDIVDLEDEDEEDEE